MCIKVCCCSMIGDHQRSAQVTAGFRADFVLLNNILCNIKQTGGFFALNVKTIFLVGDKKAIHNRRRHSFKHRTSQ